jgi:ectoine hydroxylase-related dioxygenase (phytanoyl-CoA dioxygenase family)
MSYKIYKNCITNNNSKRIFNLVVKSCEFYCPSIFHKNKSYKKTWLDKKFIDQMISFRKNFKNSFSAMYQSIRVSNEFQKILFKSNLDLIANKFLNINKNKLLVQGMQLRMDFPNDKRNSYGWHQDNAYDECNLYSKNGAVLWIPLIDTNKKNGTLIIKIGSENSSFKCSKIFKKGSKYFSKQLLVKKKFLKKYKSKSINCPKNSALTTYCGIFHKSGNNTSDHIRFTIVVRYNNQLSEDFKSYRNLNPKKTAALI